MTMESTTPSRRVCYYYDPLVGNFYYGQGHPMKPHRMRMTHNLILNYGLFRFMEIYKPRRANDAEITNYHSDEYVNFLKSINFDPRADTLKYSSKFNFGDDCPIFHGIYDFCRISAGGSIAGAVKLNKNEADIVINWSGGLHHAKKTEPSGFCYVNDIVLGIIELLKYHERVLYVDIDVHHGDGVEEAFYTTDRVMTVSFHKYGDFFPGTGDIKDIGYSEGKYYALNCPLRDGMNDEAYQSLFRPLMDQVISSYCPQAIVLQCGADSLAGDRLGCFNLTVTGHSQCVEHMKKYNIPLMLLGGGGYTIRNVSRCWTKETAVALGKEISNDIPYSDYFEYFGPDFKLDIIPSNSPNLNTPEYLEKIRIHLFENLRMLPNAPGAPMIPIPPDAYDFEFDKEMDDLRSSCEQRISIMKSDHKVHKKNEFYDDDSVDGDVNEEDGYVSKVAQYQPVKRKIDSDYVNTTTVNTKKDDENEEIPIDKDEDNSVIQEASNSELSTSDECLTVGTSGMDIKNEEVE